MPPYIFLALGLISFPGDANENQPAARATKPGETLRIDSGFRRHRHGCFLDAVHKKHAAAAGKCSGHLMPEPVIDSPGRRRHAAIVAGSARAVMTERGAAIRQEQ